MLKKEALNKVNLVQPIRKFVPMFALVLAILTTLCVFLSLLLTVLTYQSRVDRQVAEKQIVSIQRKIDQLAITAESMKNEEVFRNNLARLAPVYKTSIDVSQLFILIEAIQPENIRLTKMNVDVRKGTILLNAVSTDSEGLQQFVSALGESEYLVDALITRKSRLQGSDTDQQYTIEVSI